MAKSKKKSSENRKEAVVDGMHETTKFIASAVPLVGYLHSILVQSPAEKRLLTMIERIESDLQRLMQLHAELTIESLANNQLFITATSNTLLISIREHREEKLNVLRNITLNSALPNDIDEDIQLMFINLADTFTTWHIKLLVFFSNDKWWQSLEYLTDDAKLEGDDVVKRLMDYHSELDDVSFVNKVINDLSANQLMIMPEVGGLKLSYLVTQASEELALNSPLLTELGIKFIKCINSPLDTR